MCCQMWVICMQKVHQFTMGACNAGQFLYSLCALNTSRSGYQTQDAKGEPRGAELK